MRKADVALWIVVLLVAAVAPVWCEDAGEKGDAEAGKALFQEKCSSCHTVGGGKLVGPDLKGVTGNRDHAWLVRFITAPDAVLQSGDPAAAKLLKEYGGVPMPNLGVTQAQAESLIAYVSGEEGAEAPEAHAAAAPVTPGDAGRGKELFSGTRRFDKGGAPCLACHSIAGVGALGGGTLGPDLTGIVGRLGADGLASVLGTLPFPTMAPIYRNRPLTPAEQSDLLALFQNAAGQQPADRSGAVMGWSLLGAAILLLIAGVVWRGRLRGVRGPLVAQKRPSRSSG